jgi:hypothetical protein
MKPIYIHSNMFGAPQHTGGLGDINNIIWACLGPGFNSRTATSASAIGGILTLNFSTNPQFEALQTVEVAISSVAEVNGIHRVITNANNQITIEIPGLPDGAIGSSGAGITIKQAGAGWSRPFSDATQSVFRPPAGARRYLWCKHLGGAQLLSRGYEDMTNANDAGTKPFPSSSQGQLAIDYTSSGSKWYVVLTDKWVMLSFSTSAAATVTAGTLIFGDLSDPVNPNDMYATFWSGQDGKFICRGINDNDGGAIPCSFLTPGLSTTFVTNPNFDNKTLIPYVLTVDSQNQLRGVLSNTYALIPSVPESQFLNTYSNVAGLNGRVKPFKFNYSGSTFLNAISLDEEAWS